MCVCVQEAVLLMEHGARVDVQDEQKRTPLDMAGPALKEAMLGTLRSDLFIVHCCWCN